VKKKRAGARRMLGGRTSVVSPRTTPAIAPARSGLSLSRTNSHAARRMPKPASGSVISRAVYAIRPGFAAVSAPAIRARVSVVTKRASRYTRTAVSAPTTALTTVPTWGPGPKSQ
jgi:hypothetical protein